jgi:hypothetical protein
VKWLRHLLWKYVTQDPQYEETQIPCPAITIEGIPQDLYDKLLVEATAAGAKFEGTTAAFKGCLFDWNYDSESQTLHVTCLKKPWEFGCGTVEQHIRDLVQGAKDVVG